MSEAESKKSRMPHSDYEKAYWDVREVLDHPVTEKALLFAHRNPDLVYGEGSEEAELVKAGFLSVHEPGPDRVRKG
jgi:hypothetical protein